MTDHPSDAPRPRYSWSDEDYMFVDCGTLDKDGLGIEMTTVDVVDRLNALEADLGRARGEIERLRLALVRVHSEYRELEEAARVAEGKAEVYRERVHFLQHQHSSNIGPSCHMCLAMLEDLTPAADAAEETNDG